MKTLSLKHVLFVYFFRAVFFIQIIYLKFKLIYTHFSIEFYYFLRLVSSKSEILLPSRLNESTRYPAYQ